MPLNEEAGMAEVFFFSTGDASGTSKFWINIGHRMSYSED